MTIKEFEDYYHSLHIKPASLLFQGDSQERISSLRNYLSGGETPNYTYETLVAYCTNPGGIEDDRNHLNECLDLIKTVVVNNELESIILELYKQKLLYRISERELVLGAYKDIINPSSKNNEVFENSKKLYGELDTSLYLEYIKNPSDLHKFDSVLEKYYPVIRKEFDSYYKVINSNKNKDLLDSTEITEIANHILQHFRFDDWKAVKTNRSTGVRIIQSVKEIWIPESINRSPHDVIKLLIHEIGVHVTRRVSGKKSKYAILSDGTQLDNQIEEGVSIFIEAVIDAEVHTLPTALYRASYRYLALIYAMQLDGVKRLSVRQVYEDLKTHNQKFGGHVSDNQLIDIIDNIYRGTNFINPSNVYLRAKVYLEGFIKVVNYAENKNPSVELLDSILRARYDFTDAEEVKLLKVVN